MDRSSASRNKTRKTSVLIVDDDPIVREVLRARLEAADYEVMGLARNGEDALKLAQSLGPDVILLDILMPGLSGLEIASRLLSSGVKSRCILVTSSIRDSEINEALTIGVKGIILKEYLIDLRECLVSVIRGDTWVCGERVSDAVALLKTYGVKAGAAKSKVTNGKRFGLTTREQEIVLLVTQGCSNKDIAQKLGISQDTVKRHMTHIFDKVGMSSRLELALFAVEHRLVPDPAKNA
ncbi:MAG: response regulator transcription factor [Acidobacteriales bacterium]|nr:response regulator transcription factor [Terriglobales bacterium]